MSGFRRFVSNMGGKAFAKTASSGSTGGSNFPTSWSRHLTKDINKDQSDESKTYLEEGDRANWVQNKQVAELTDEYWKTPNPSSENLKREHKWVTTQYDYTTKDGRPRFSSFFHVIVWTRDRGEVYQVDRLKVGGDDKYPRSRGNGHLVKMEPRKKPSWEIFDTQEKIDNFYDRWKP